ncbi:hypothetical protein TUN199_04281 [Pyrenophora tritici-repentis]|nr:hypothetical protein PtrV1_12486 [Pyrenophora tritici-repentis]KAI0580734.1 hypothetical protein Alg215_05070 [Pyrenophora tritici-repentis]KAI0623733.1 hypothetical protein TUN199_04281 [Pyrenophora tritici-repentis]
MTSPRWLCVLVSNFLILRCDCTLLAVTSWCFDSEKQARIDFDGRGNHRVRWLIVNPNDDCWSPHCPTSSQHPDNIGRTAASTANTRNTTSGGSAGSAGSGSGSNTRNTTSGGSGSGGSSSNTGNNSSSSRSRS